jgi:RNA polymerase-binding protein DksA
MIDECEQKTFREQLMERRRQILEQLNHFREALADLEQSRPPEMSEEAQEEATASSLVALEEQERKELGEITRALEKLDSGDFGKCEYCSKQIVLERLLALPMVRYCIRCQTKIEEGLQVSSEAGGSS